MRAYEEPTPTSKRRSAHGPKVDATDAAIQTQGKPEPGLTKPLALLDLQRTAGNQAVSKFVQRMPRPRPAGGPAPSSLTCPVPTSPPPEVGTAVIFATGRASVDPAMEKVIDRFLDLWNKVRTDKRAGVGDPIEVHGFASLTGSPGRNWDLSCRRAEAVGTVLRMLLHGRGLPLPNVTVFAHGPTNVFDPAPLRNQRAMISPAKWDDYLGTVSKPRAGTFPGLGARKRVLTSAGGNLLDMAVAMLETDKMLPDYTFGDDKQEDAACFGIFKQNWHYIRTSGAMPQDPGRPRHGRSLPGLDLVDWDRGELLNLDPGLDVKVLHASQAQLGLNGWFAAHRQGETGLEAFRAAARGSTTAAKRGTLSDIATYQNAVEWIRDQLTRDPALQTDDRKVFVQVPAV